jgi:hypothetical protein
MGSMPGTTICGLADGNNWAVRTIMNKYRDEFEATRSERDRAEGVLQEAAVFERTTRGGPQRVIYHLTADGVCEMRVALLPEGAQVWETEVAFRFKRVSASR